MICTDAEKIDSGNIISELQKAMAIHVKNSGEIKYLWDYYRGKQPILYRVKKVRPEICNKIVENRANEIVSFKVGYLCGEPIQYISRSVDETTSKGISFLNEMMFSENKASKDKEVIEWQMISGTSYRLVLPDEDFIDDGVPFNIFTLDPRYTFVVYSNEIGNKPMFGATYYQDESGINHFSVYSKDNFWKIVGSNIIENKPHALDDIPIFEYPANNARLGSFEIVLPLLDEINNISSNRMDGIEQFVQSFVKFINCDIDETKFSELKALGAIKVKSIDGNNADVDIVSSELSQSDTQITKEDCYNSILTICGMPNRNGGTSTSDTGAAVLLRDGWSLAEARAKDSELMFKKSEQKMLKLVLRICRDTKGVPSEINALGVKDIALQFTRRNYENVQSKSQVLVSMLQQEKIHPRLAFTSCGLFSDPEQAYAESMENYNAEKRVQDEIDTTEQTNRQGSLKSQAGENL